MTLELSRLRANPGYNPQTCDTNADKFQVKAGELETGITDMRKTAEQMQEKIMECDDESKQIMYLNSIGFLTNYQIPSAETNLRLVKEQVQFWRSEAARLRAGKPPPKKKQSTEAIIGVSF